MRVARGRNGMSGYDDVLSCDVGPATDLGVLSNSHDYSTMQMRVATSLYLQLRASCNECIVGLLSRDKQVARRRDAIQMMRISEHVSNPVTLELRPTCFSVLFSSPTSSTSFSECLRRHSVSCSIICIMFTLERNPHSLLTCCLMCLGRTQ